MRWFKHDSDASNDAKLRKLRLKYGAQGYGIYWYCLELIARNVDKHNLTFELEHDAVLIAEDFKISSELVQEMMTYMVNLGLFENSHGVITCLKMSTRTDEYTQQLMRDIKKSPESVPRVSLESPDGVPRISEVREEKRKEKNNSEKKSNDFIFPDWLDLSLWNDFKLMRKTIKKPMTDRAEKLIINDLTKFKDAGLDPMKSLEQSIRNSWQDVYEPKVNVKVANDPNDWKKGML